MRRLPVEFRTYARRKIFKPRTFNDSFDTWESAVSASTGYGTEEVIASVVEATHRVVTGEAVYERDSITFTSPEYSWQILSGLMLAAASEHSLRVVDFGGSLGSTFFQYRRFLQLLPQVEWSVVEQEAFIKAAQNHVHEPGLNFYGSFETALEETMPSLIYFGSSLQYLKNPWATLKSATFSSARYLIIDRIPVTDLDENKITVQIVPPEIYPASYPAWLFSKHELLHYLEEDWEVLSEFQSLGGQTYASSGTPVTWWGILCVRRPPDNGSLD